MFGPNPNPNKPYRDSGHQRYRVWCRLAALRPASTIDKKTKGPMLFNTPLFFVFFIVFLLFYGLIFVQKKPRLYFILVASLVFYGA